MLKSLPIHSVTVDSGRGSLNSAAALFHPAVDGWVHARLRVVVPVSAFRAYAGQSALRRAAFSNYHVRWSLAQRLDPRLGRSRHLPFVASEFIGYLDASGAALPSPFVNNYWSAAPAGSVYVEYAFILFLPPGTVPGVLSALGVE